MKKLTLTALILAGAFAWSNTVNAQVKVNVNVDVQPVWGPVGYDYVEYYYLPDLEMYYYVPGKQYVYRSGNRWIRSKTLPERYRNFDFYKAHKVVINENKPYLHHNDNASKYATFRDKHDQQPIRDSHDKRYFSNKNHPEHGNGKDNNRRPH